ncbi:MAG: transcriptional regulator [Acidimicrobiaceae bacterium]|nr:transcriptional regulator [Acidimicrobiaceae bacterium]
MKQSLLIETIIDLADTLVDDFDIVDVLTMLSSRCAEVLDANAVGVVLRSREGELQYVASSSESMHVLELFQLQSKEGPCIDCYHSGDPIVNVSLNLARERWPRFAPEALAAGFQSVHCLPLRLRKQTIGALNLFRFEEGRMQANDVLLAQALADIATISILQNRATLDSELLNTQLTTALESRIIIEQAKGIVAQSESCNMEIAFTRIRSHARNHNRRLSELATDLIEGTLPARDLDQL